MFRTVLLCALLAAAFVSADEKVKVQHIDFRDLSLQDALRLLSEQTGLNIVATAEARKNPVSLFLHDVTALEAIEELCKTNELAFKRDEASGIIRILSLQEFQRSLVTPRQEKTEVFTLLYPNAVPIAVAIRDLYGDRVLLSLGREADNEQSRDLQQGFDRFDVIDQRSQGLGLFQGGGVNGFNGGGGGGGGGFGGGRFSNVNDNNNLNDRATRRTDRLRDNIEARRDADEFRNMTAEQAQRIQKLLDSGKTAAEIETGLAGLRRQEADIFVALNKKNNMVMIRTSDQKIMEDIKQLICKLDVPTSMVLLEVKVLSIELGDDFDSVFDYQFTDGVTSAGGFGAGLVQPPAADLLSGAARRAAPLALGGSGLNSGAMIFQFVNNNFRARLQLLESKNKITTLATPMLLTANSEVSRLFVGEERPIIRNISSQTVVNNNTVTSTPNTTVEFRPVGTTLLITPSINADKTVTLRVLQENSSINPQAANIPVVTGNGNVTEQNVDVVATRTVSGTIIAKDRLMVAVGGLIEDNLHDQRSQVPVLGRIPVLGIPFRKQNTGRNRRELIVLCRPYVVSTPAEAEDISKQLMGELSIHPKSPDADGAMKTFNEREVLKPQPPKDKKEQILGPHTKYEGK